MTQLLDLNAVVDRRGWRLPLQENLIAIYWRDLMARLVHCVKLGREMEGLDFQTYPGELGKRIFDNVSKEAWAGWIRHQTMLVNENCA